MGYYHGVHEGLVSYDWLVDPMASSCSHSEDQRDLERGHEMAESWNDCGVDLGI